MDKNILASQEQISTTLTTLRGLRNRTISLRSEMSRLYDDLHGALDTEAGDEMALDAKDVVLEPIENLENVIYAMENVLEKAKGNDYYQAVCDKYETLNNSIKFN